MTLPLSITTHSRDPQPYPAVRDAQRWLSRKAMTIDVDGIFGPKTHQATLRFQRKAGLEVDGIIGPKTWQQLSHSGGSGNASGTTGGALRALAYKIATGGYNGGRSLDYQFGAENDLFHPERCKQTDCSELVQLCITKLTGKVWLDGSWNQYGGCQRIPVSQAMRTPGALVFHTRNGRASGIHHVAVSYGDSVHTIEARSEHTNPEVGVFDGRGRFNLAGLIPGFQY
jgi:cell wall-associated NlpC family hydrolase